MDAVNEHTLEPELDALRSAWPERALSALAMVALGLLCLIVTLTVVARWLGTTFVPDDVLLVRELMVAIVLLPLGVVTACREHIEVSVFTERVALRGKRMLAVLGHLVGIVFAGGLFWAAMSMLGRAWSTGEYYYGDLYIPVWIGNAVFAFGVGAFLLRLLALLLIDLHRCFRR